MRLPPYIDRPGETLPQKIARLTAELAPVLAAKRRAVGDARAEHANDNSLPPAEECKPWYQQGSFE